jgi:hypothetical protein
MVDTVPSNITIESLVSEFAAVRGAEDDRVLPLGGWSAKGYGAGARRIALYVVGCEKHRPIGMSDQT